MKSQLVTSAAVVACLVLFLVAIRRDAQVGLEAASNLETSARPASGLNALLPFGWIVPMPEAPGRANRATNPKELALGPKQRKAPDRPAPQNPAVEVDTAFDEELFEELYEEAAIAPPAHVGNPDSLPKAAAPHGPDRADMS